LACLRKKESKEASNTVYIRVSIPII